ncbi:hypothetical protein PHYSODRAFT_322672 [Phytophthora sojae]|uniref:Protein kinase domain-containing protein n=1 Tax=Phytophthora sojae (strain P6497) TaxID=1094619 RepID=G4YHK5_PHYSP|nr:hypothetical protein PHYSODRAFT_322672 [Phytophthora sojae]EGZ29110.1 hypothetical protein PHYSODRAFT_322672 [Phytophthora sojae]|eukprot:XP_009516385.1 hypothetical protein PHYSODRAFT_322672 [Phytophthora sojae]
MAREPPFAFLRDDDVRDLLRNGGVIDKPNEMADHVWKVVELMLKADPSERSQLQGVIDKLEFLADVETLEREDLWDAMRTPLTDVMKDISRAEGVQQKRSAEPVHEARVPKKRMRCKKSKE